MTDSPTSITSFDALPEGTQIGGYTIQRLLGQGGFGITYLAHHKVMERSVAIKEFFPVGLARRDSQSRISYLDVNAETIRWALEKFQTTTTSLCKLEHRNIVKVHDYLPMHDTGYMIMEMLDGVTLKSWLKQRQSPPTLEDLKPIMNPVMEALSYVHGKGLVHRDIAPDNILITRDNRPVLIDFGSASADLSNAMSRVTGTIGVTKRHYTAPEQSVARATPVPSADIYSLGAVFYRALSGEKPADGAERKDALFYELPDPLEPLSAKPPAGCPAAAVAAIDASLSLKMADRPASVAVFRQKLGFAPGEAMTPIVDRPKPNPPADAGGATAKVAPGAGAAGGAKPADGGATQVVPGAGGAAGGKVAPPPKSRVGWLVGAAGVLAVLAVLALLADAQKKNAVRVDPGPITIATTETTAPPPPVVTTGPLNGIDTSPSRPVVTPDPPVVVTTEPERSVPASTDSEISIGRSTPPSTPDPGPAPVIETPRPPEPIFRKPAEQRDTERFQKPVDTAALTPAKSFQTVSNTDIGGPDIGRVSASSSSGCEQQCRTNSACRAYSFDKWNNLCFLKSRASTLKLEPKAVSGYVRGESPSRSGVTVAIERYRGRAFPNRAASTAPASSFEACEARCKNSDSCIAYSFQASSGDCGQFTSVGEYSPRSGVDIGVKRQK